MHYDVLVIGAGPAGSSLSIQLARAGKSVLLVDGARFPRGKVCGEGIMPAGVAVLESLGLLEAVAPMGQHFHGIRYRLPDGTAAEGHFPEGCRGLAVTRQRLDARLVELAGATPGVDLRLGTWIRDLRLPAPGSGDLVEAVVGARTVRAEVVVGADGGRSLVRRTAGLELPTPAKARFGIGAHLEHAPRHDPWPVVEVSMAPGCELYLTPVSPTLTSVAMLVDRRQLQQHQGQLEQGLREALRRAGATDLAVAPVAGPVKALGPLALQAKAAHAERLLLVGDAAGALDPITGEGIALALISSQLVAGVLDDAFAHDDFSARRLATWTRMRKREIRQLSGLTAVILYLAQHPQRAQRVIRSLARAPQTLERLLAVAAGVAPLRSLTVRDGLRVLLGV